VKFQELHVEMTVRQESLEGGINGRSRCVRALSGFAWKEICNCRRIYARNASLRKRGMGVRP
jgi:hypothetical protein